MFGLTDKLTPGNNGENCRFNGNCKNIFGKTIECCCDECDYLMCCLPEKYAKSCENCSGGSCPRGGK